MALPVLLVSFYDLGFGLGFIFISLFIYNHPSVRKLWLRRFIGDEGPGGAIWVFFFTAVRVEKSKRLRFHLILCNKKARWETVMCVDVVIGAGVFWCVK